MVRERSKSSKARKMLDNSFVLSMNKIEKRICSIKSVGRQKENILYFRRCSETSIINLTEAQMPSR